MPRITINDQPIDARPGQTVLEAARDLNITIPTLCYHPDLSPVGSCRLCLVEVEGIPRLMPACQLPVTQDMVVHTETPDLVNSRKLILEMLLLNYVDSGQSECCDDTEFMRWVRHYDAQRPGDALPGQRYQVDSDPNPFVRVDFNKCILCTRCIRACNEVQGRFVWWIGNRGAESRIVAGTDTTMLEARCESCGACAAFCPTGALDDRMASGHGKPDRTVTTTCGYCGVGCQFDLNVKGERIVRVTSNPNAPVNGMSLCVKGRYGYDYVHHVDRLTKPRVREYLLEGSEVRPVRDQAMERGAWIEVEWGTALDIVAGVLVQVKRESGPSAIGFLASAKCTNEENYLAQKFARQVLGTHNVDHCARLCHASTIAGLAMCYGSGAMSNSMDDIAEQAAAMFIIGSNTTEQHPVFGTMIRQAVLRRGAKLVVADPRKIDMTEFATLHLRQKPGTDVALINGLMYIILKNGWQDQKFMDERCEGFAEFEATVQGYSPRVAAEITGVPVEDLHRAAVILSQSRPMAVIWAMGITQHTTGVLNVLSLGNLQMLLGNMGVPGGGVNPLRGQNNVQGACDMGALPNVFPGYQPVSDPDVRAKFARAWALETDLGMPSLLEISGTPGLTVMELIEGAGNGRLQALFIQGEDPAMTDPDSNHVRKCLEACPFVVLQEIFPSETSAYADVLLPGASFAEKSGTFTNTERRVQLVRKAIDPPGEAWPDWKITIEIARRVLAREGRRPTGPQAAWDYGRPAQIMDEVAALTPSYAGVNHSRLERGERLQWPVPEVDHPGTPILHIGQFTRGKGRFHAIEHLPAAELPDADYPFLLTTGRVLYHWHGGELTRRVGAICEVYPESLIEISAEDSARLCLGEGSRVRVRSRRGEMVARAIITVRVSQGVIFANFHFPGAQNVNNLTIAALDPLAKIPEYKVCAVNVEAVDEGSDWAGCE